MTAEYPAGYTPMTFHEKAQAWQAALESEDAVAFIEKAVLARLPKPDTAERELLAKILEAKSNADGWERQAEDRLNDWYKAQKRATELLAQRDELLRELRNAIAQADMAGDCIESGRYDEALLHCRSLMRPKYEAIAKVEGGGA